MAWKRYNPMRWASKKLEKDLPGTGEDEKRREDLEAGLRGQSKQSGRWAGQRGAYFDALGRTSDAEREYLQGIASGKNSISAEQLREGLRQNMAAQQSMASGVRGGGSVSAARNAAVQSAQLQSGLAGQTEIAGMQERRAAQEALANLLMQQRAQEGQAALGARGQAIGGLGHALNTETGQAGQPTWVEKYGPSIAAGVGTIAMLSDKRAKTNIEHGDTEAAKFLKGLRAHRYDYKDSSHGKGKQVGIMAQDLERTEAGRQAVIDTPNGKMVHGGKLAAAIAATLPGLDKRLRKLEGNKRG